MVTVLVEDDITCFPYQLLVENCGCSLLGSKGNKKLASKMLELEQDVIVLIDVIPNNWKTVVLYDKALKMARAMHNAYVIPILCIEYYFIHAFLGYINVDTAAVLLFENYQKHVKNVSNKELDCSRSYEKFCKSVLHSYSKCMRNNVFVSTDCICADKPFPLQCKDIPLSIKKKKLFYSLPLFLLGRKTFTVDAIREAIKTGEELYYKAAAEFVNNGLISTIIELPKNII